MSGVFALADHAPIVLIRMVHAMHDDYQCKCGAFTSVVSVDVSVNKPAYLVM